MWNRFPWKIRNGLLRDMWSRSPREKWSDLLGKSGPRLRTCGVFFGMSCLSTLQSPTNFSHMPFFPDVMFFLDSLVAKIFWNAPCFFLNFRHFFMSTSCYSQHHGPEDNFEFKIYTAGHFQNPSFHGIPREGPCDPWTAKRPSCDDYECGCRYV